MDNRNFCSSRLPSILCRIPFPVSVIGICLGLCFCALDCGRVLQWFQARGVFIGGGYSKDDETMPVSTCCGRCGRSVGSLYSYQDGQGRARGQGFPANGKLKGSFATISLRFSIVAEESHVSAMFQERGVRYYYVTNFI